MPPTPQRTRTYRHHHLDSTRWDAFRPRTGDIVIATSYKAGTTWTQAIVANLLFPGGAFPAAVWEMSPWIDMRAAPVGGLMEKLEAQTHRRFVKTHLPLDALPWHPEVRYIFVGRDGRDVFMSLWNHYTNYTDETFARFNDTPGRVGPPVPRPPEDIHELWRNWCSRGSFDWETDGWPFWSHLRVTQSWWEHRAQPNILMLHYADLKADTGAEVRRVARFLGLDRPAAELDAVTEAVSLEAMRRQAETYAPRGGASWKGGARGFLYKGTNGRWRDVLSTDELMLYEAACDRALTPDCRAWLAAGGPA